MSILSSKILITRRLAAMLLLGFTSGLPLALTSSTLQAWFTEAHIDVVTIGSLSLLGIPYILKFLWAPLMDHYRLPGFGRRQAWILLTQLGLVITLLLLANMQPATQAAKMSIIALTFAFFSASQDVAVDAYRADILPCEERGLGAAYFIFTYRVAALLSGGLALMFANYFGWKLTYEIMAVLILLAIIPTFYTPKSVEIKLTTPTIFHTVYASIKDLLQREKILLLLLFVIFYKFGAALEISLMTNFLLHGLGFSLVEVGFAFKVIGFIAILLGAFFCGIILTRWNIYRALLWFGLAQAFSNLMFIVLAIMGKNFLFMTTSLFIENFCTGLSITAFLAFLMSLCDRRFSAGQFALLSAIDSIGRVFLGPIAGLIVKNYGWVQLYFCSFILCFPGIIFLMFLKDKVSSYAYATNND